LPDGLNVFSWSLPFLAEKVSSMLYTIVKKCTDVDEEKVDISKIVNEQTAETKKKKLLNIKSKVQSVAKISKMFSTLREEQEIILKIKNISPDGKLPRGILLEGKPAIKNAAKQFNFAAELDRENEKRPKKRGGK
jgi:serine/threonine-protein phosphatase 2B catalytic subunit